MNLPNRLTIVRIIFGLLIVVLLLFPYNKVNIDMIYLQISTMPPIPLNYVVSGILFIIASITDFLDGYIARKYGLITNTGKMLDAISDKILVNSVLITLAGLGDIHPIIPVVIVLRDIIVNTIKMEAANKGVVVAAIKSGKIKTAALMTGISLAFFYNFPFELVNVKLCDFLLYFATIMSIVSMFQYYSINKKIIVEK